MALSPKNRKVVGGLIVVGALGGGPMVLSLINFAGDATGAGVDQYNKVAPHVGPGIEHTGDLAVTGLAQFNKLNTLNDTTATTAPAASSGE